MFSQRPPGLTAKRGKFVHQDSPPSFLCKYIGFFSCLSKSVSDGNSEFAPLNFFSLRSKFGSSGSKKDETGHSVQRAYFAHLAAGSGRGFEEEHDVTRGEAESHVEAQVASRGW